MTFIDQIRRVEKLDLLIRTKSTGTPAELAVKLGISQSQLFNLLKVLRETFKAPVYYSRAEQSYCYEMSVKVRVELIKSN